MARPPFRSRTLAALVAAGALALAACSSSPSKPNASANTSTTASGNTTRSTAFGTIPADDRSPAGTFGTEPTIVVPQGHPPAYMLTADLIPGTGKQAEDGDALTVQYVLATYSTRKVVQSSWSSQPFTFTLGAGQVIPGWDKGLVGMSVGGRRELIIPPDLGYGAQSPGAGIAPNDTLVFVVDLLKVS
jgi:peptidylprolyl isomerase